MTGEGLQILTNARHSWPLTVRVLKFVTPAVTWASVYNGHLRGSVTLTPIVEPLAVELSPPFFMS